MSARFDDLFAYGRSGICHLRVYKTGEGESIALVVELEDNPGVSVINGAEGLIDRIVAVFGRRPRLFTIFPKHEARWTEILGTPGSSDVDFASNIEHIAVERIVGEPVELPAPGECTTETLGGTSHPLRSLIPPPETPPNMLDGMQVVAVADLPWAHNPWKCAHAERYQAVRKLYGKGCSGEIASGAHFFLSLDADQLAACPYHQHDWLAIAAASVKLLNRLPPTSSQEEVLKAADKLLHRSSDRSQLHLLFTDPIAWHPDSTTITNGQHRACALKAANAPLCVALTHNELPGNAAPADPRRRAQRTLAEYWMKQLA